MKGISIAIETIIYLVLAVTVLAVLLMFFLGNVPPSERQFKFERDRSSFCGAYVTQTGDLKCAGKDGRPADVAAELLNKIGSACKGLREFGYYYPCEGTATLECIQQCCTICGRAK